MMRTGARNVWRGAGALAATIVFLAIDIFAIGPVSAGPVSQTGWMPPYPTHFASVLGCPPTNCVGVTQADEQSGVASVSIAMLNPLDVEAAIGMAGFTVTHHVDHAVARVDYVVHYEPAYAVGGSRIYYFNNVAYAEILGPSCPIVPAERLVYAFSSPNFWASAVSPLRLPVPTVPAAPSLAMTLLAQPAVGYVPAGDYQIRFLVGGIPDRFDPMSASVTFDSIQASVEELPSVAAAPILDSGFPKSRSLAVELEWEPPAFDGGSPVTSYRVYSDLCFVRTGPLQCDERFDSGYHLLGETNATWFVDIYASLDGYSVSRYIVAAVNANGEGPTMPYASGEAGPGGVRVISRIRNATAQPGGSVRYTFEVFSNETGPDTFDLAAEGKRLKIDPPSVTLDHGQTAYVTVEQNLSMGTGTVPITVVATSRADPTITDSFTAGTLVG